MTYQAQSRIRITLPDGSGAAPKSHEDAGDGTPACGTPARQLRGRQLVYTRVGPGPVEPTTFCMASSC